MHQLWPVADRRWVVAKYFDSTRDIRDWPGVLDEALDVNEAQDRATEDFYRAYPGRYIAKFQVRKYVFNDQILDTSVGRSINTLTKRGVLTKMPKKYNIMGPRRRPVCVWRLRSEWDVVDKDGMFIRYKTQYEMEHGVITQGPLPDGFTEG
jgi:hypothetical protein